MTVHAQAQLVLQQSLHPPGRPRHVVLAFDLEARRPPHLQTFARRAHQPVQRVGEGGDATGCHEETLRPIGHELGDAHDARRHHRELHRHRLHGHHRDPFCEAREAEDVGTGIALADVVLSDGTEEVDVLREPHTTCDCFELPARRPVADDARGDLEASPAQLGHRLEEQREALAVQQATDEEDLRTTVGA
jgi:hypothetical protein